jgi:hypothetical protein
MLCSYMHLKLSFFRNILYLLVCLWKRWKFGGQKEDDWGGFVQNKDESQYSQIIDFRVQISDLPNAKIIRLVVFSKNKR